MGKEHGDTFLKFMLALVTASAIKISVDISEIKTSVAVAVTRIEAHEERIRALEHKL